MTDAGEILQQHDRKGWGWVCLAGTIGLAAHFALVGLLGRYFVSWRRTGLWAQEDARRKAGLES